MPVLLILSLLLALVSPEPSRAASGEALGARISLIWGLPFVLLLLSIALIPLIHHRFWHNHYGKVAAFWALAFLVPFLAVFGLSETVYELAHVALLEYFPFVILLFSLFVVSGGIVIGGNFPGVPLVNVGFLAFGTVLASFIGTTGASMVLIRPVLRANKERPGGGAHVIIFFIFLVSNIGGSLSPLGDPPLFLGFLKGVNFFWPTTNLFVPMLILSACLLVVFYLLDRFAFAHAFRVQTISRGSDIGFSFKGKRNLILLMVIVGAVLMSGLVESDLRWTVLGTEVLGVNLLRDAILLAAAGASLALTPRAYRTENGFEWEPIREVAKLFAGIFVTIIPVIAILRVGLDGDLDWLIALVSNADGSPNNVAYFWLTGTLSGFLDNAPTYVVFFNAAGGDADQLMGPMRVTLLAISCGAVFMGALTYIGNAPNLMVRSIASGAGVKMPSFFGYMGWSLVFIVPPTLLITWLFFL